MIVEAVKAALLLETVIAESGVHLRHGKALCPFHDDRNPSFSVKGARWICFAGCGSGDLVDFASKFYGLDTKGAIRLLADRAGITPARTQAERIAAAEARREREEKKRLMAAFRAWEQNTVNEIAAVLRAFNRLRTVRTDFSEAELVELARLQGNIDILGYHYSVLCGKDDREKYELFKEDLGYAG